MSVNYVDENGKLQRIAGGTLYADAPIGAIVSFGGTTAPSGWLLCQGQAVSRTTYAELFKAIGTAFGSGDGSTTFNVPDLREATTKGVGLTGKSSNHYDSDGVALGEFVEDRLKDHVHIVTAIWNSAIAQGTTATNPAAEAGGTNGTRKTQGVDNARTGNTTEVKAVGVNYIIKAVQVGVPQDIQSYLEEIATYKVDDDYFISRSNKTVKIHCYGKTVEQLASNTTYTIPEDCRPSTRCSGMVYLRYSDKAYIGFLSVRTDGTITTSWIPDSYPHDNYSAPNNATLYFDYTYVI